MTDMRDARFKRALDEAPDAQLRPDARVRASVLDAARRAVEPAPSPSVWKKWWNVTGSASPAWNAAFATIAVATLATVVWYDRDIPEAQPQSTVADRAAPSAPAPAPVIAPETGPAAVAQNTAKEAAPAAPKKPAAAPTKQATPENSLAKDRAREPAGAPLQEQERGESAATGSVTPKAADAAGASIGAATNQRSDAAAEARVERRAKQEVQAARVQQVAPPPPLAPPSPAAPAAPAAVMAPAPTMVAPRSAAPVVQAFASSWTSVRINSGNRSAQIERSQAERLAELLASIDRMPTATSPAQGVATHSFTLQGGASSGETIDVFGAQIRVVRTVNGERRESVYEPAPSTIEAIKAEADRLLLR